LAVCPTAIPERVGTLGCSMKTRAGPSSPARSSLASISSTPPTPTLEALHDVVKAGKVRYLGASSMFAWQFCKALYLADLHGWTRFISMQNHYNLLYREEEREMLGLCAAEGTGVLPWSPLARGRLARAWDTGASTVRGESDDVGKSLYQASEDADRLVVQRVGELADARGIPRAQIALAWLLQRPAVTSPIVGATKPQHLEDAAGALSVQLSNEEVAALEAPYPPTVNLVVLSPTWESKNPCRGDERLNVEIFTRTQRGGASQAATAV
jgi:aryl-alcohol dehydrogenase-like predicted oxidoreductase